MEIDEFKKEIETDIIMEDRPLPTKKPKGPPAGFLER